MTGGRLGKDGVECRARETVYKVWHQRVMHGPYRRWRQSHEANEEGKEDLGLRNIDKATEARRGWLRMNVRGKGKDRAQFSSLGDRVGKNFAKGDMKFP